MSRKKDKIFAPIKGRLIQFIEKQGVGKEKFYKEVGIASGNFKGRGAESELGGAAIAKILTLYPMLSSDWLILGVGEMIRHSSTIMNEPEEKYEALEQRIIELEKKLK